MLEEFVKSSIAELEKLNEQDELTEHDEGKLIAYHTVAEKMACCYLCELREGCDIRCSFLS